MSDEEKNPEEQNQEIADNILKAMEKLSSQLSSEYGIDSCVLSVSHPDMGHPVVYYSGDEVQYTELSAVVCHILRNRIMSRIYPERRSQ